MTEALTPRQLIAALEIQADTQDELTRRLIESLKSYADAAEDMEALQNRANKVTMERSAMIAEAAIIVTEAEHGCTIRKLFRDRVPMRVLQ